MQIIFCQRSAQEEGIPKPPTNTFLHHQSNCHCKTRAPPSTDHIFSWLSVGRETINFPSEMKSSLKLTHYYLIIVFIVGVESSSQQLLPTSAIRSVSLCYHLYFHVPFPESVLVYGLRLAQLCPRSAKDEGFRAASNRKGKRSLGANGAANSSPPPIQISMKMMMMRKKSFIRDSPPKCP